MDEATLQIRDFPADKGYVREALEAIEELKWVVFPKSRRRFASWLAAIYLVWAARYRQVMAGFWQSANEDRAALMIEKRCAWVEKNLKTAELRRQTREIRTAKGTIGRIEYGPNSYLWAIPAGGDTIRSATPSIIVGDEYDFQPDADKALQATVPLVLDGKTKFIQITTSNGPRYPVARICKEIGFIRWQGRAQVGPGKILDRYPSPRGATVIPIHYSHDTDCGPDYADEARAACTTENEYLREYEIDFGSWVGALAYPNHSPVNRVSGYVVNPDLPLCLACDFNVQPMVWNYGQIVGGRPRAIGQIKIDNNATVEAMVREFRNRFPAHRAEVRVYGDATGRARGQTAKSDYDLIALAFRGYSAPVVFFVPPDNPGVRNRINAVNRALKGADGVPLFTYDPEGCPDLEADFLEVAWRQDGRDLLKVYDPTDPYSERTHSSDGIGYWIWREFSIADELAAESARARPKPRPRPGRPVLIGDEGL